MTVHFNKNTYSDYLKEAYKKTVKIHTRLPEGGVLIFVTGQQEVKLTEYQVFTNGYSNVLSLKYDINCYSSKILNSLAMPLPVCTIRYFITVGPALYNKFLCSIYMCILRSAAQIMPAQFLNAWNTRRVSTRKSFYRQTVVIRFATFRESIII